MQTRKIIGQILEKKIDEKDLWTKYSFIVKTNNGKTMTLGLFIKDAEKENERLRKEALIKDFKKGDTAEFEFYDKTDEKTTYHNIIDIKDVETATKSDLSEGEETNEPDLDFDELKRTDEKYNIVPLDKNVDNILTEQQKKDLGYFKGQCLNLASSHLNHNPISSYKNYPYELISLAKNIFDEGKKQKFLEWR